MDVPKTLDWVTVRAECSIERLFMLLCELMDSDVKTMQARSPTGMTQFSFNRIAESKVVVARVKHIGGGFSDGDNVTIEKTATGISVVAGRGSRQLFMAKPSVGPDGVCRLHIGDEPCELWQVSRKALEDLFFS